MIGAFSSKLWENFFHILKYVKVFHQKNQKTTTLGVRNTNLLL